MLLVRPPVLRSSPWFVRSRTNAAVTFVLPLYQFTPNDINKSSRMETRCR